MKKTLPLFFILFLFPHCKKKDNTGVQNSHTQTTNNVTSSNLVTIVTGESSFHGFISTVRSSVVSSSGISTQTVSTAEFYASAVTASQPNRVMVNSVILNKDSLLPDSNRYKIVPHPDYENDWKIMGNNGIPSFSLSLGSYPYYKSIDWMPDTVSKSEEVRLDFVNIFNITYGHLLIEQVKNDSSVRWLKRNLTNTYIDTFTFDEIMLSKFDAGPATMTVLLEKVIMVKVAGRNFKFTQSHTLKKAFHIKP